MEAANGCKRKVFVNIDKTCGTCGGSGAKSGTKPDKCKTCGGVGRVVKAKGPFQTIRLTFLCFLSLSLPTRNCLILPLTHRAARALHATARAKSLATRASLAGVMCFTCALTCCLCHRSGSGSQTENTSVNVDFPPGVFDGVQLQVLNASPPPFDPFLTRIAADSSRKPEGGHCYKR